MSQSLPNQVNDFNAPRFFRWGALEELSQSLPNQVNDFNSVVDVPEIDIDDPVAIPSKPGQRLQCWLPMGSNWPQARVAIPSKPGQRLQ